MHNAIGLYTCFKRPLIALIEDKESIVLCDPLTLGKVLIFQIPDFHIGVQFAERILLDEHGQVMLLSKHLVGVLSFTPSHPVMKLAEARQDLPIEYEVPKPMFLFGKDISIQTSLDQWEASLATNTHTDYDERVT